MLLAFPYHAVCHGTDEQRWHLKSFQIAQLHMTKNYSGETILSVRHYEPFPPIGHGCKIEAVHAEIIVYCTLQNLLSLPLLFTAWRSVCKHFFGASTRIRKEP